MAIKITDLVDVGEIDKLNQLDTTLLKVLDTYTRVAKDLAKGLEINVGAVGDIDRLEKLLVDKGKEAANAQEQLTQVIAEQGKVIANTTNTISRQLMEQERVNKTQREAYTEHDRVKKLLEQYHDTYEGQIQRLVRLNALLNANNKAQKDNDKALSAGRISMAQYQAQQAELIADHRSLTQEKRTLTQLMTAEEKAAQSTEGSYAHMSQQFELLKKALKDLSDEGRNSDFGKELEETVQNLDAHLKDLAADMGEYQRNVGNYAIANNGLKKQYDELIGSIAVLQQKFDKLSEADKAGEMGQQLAAEIEKATAAATEAKQAFDEQARAIENARRAIEGTASSTTSVKRDLKELVLEIANLTVEYQELSEAEQNSARGQELAEHIRELTEKAGVLKDAIADTTAAIANAASDTRTFDQLGGAIQLAIDGFGLAQGAAAMLGISEQELAEIQTKLQAAIAASNAMQSIQNTLQSQSAVMQGVHLIQLKMRTAAEKAHTAAQGKGVVATKAATVAQWAFNAAATANPIGLLVAGIVAAAAAVWGLVKAFNSFVGTSEEANKQLDRQIEKINQLKQANEDMIGVLQASGASSEYIAARRLKYADEEIAKTREAIRVAKEKGKSDEKVAELEAQLKEDEKKQLNDYEAQYYGFTKLVREQNALELKEKQGSAAAKKKLLNQEIDDQKLLIEQLRATAALYGYQTDKLDEALDALEKKRAQGMKEINREAFNESQTLMKELQSAVRKGEDDMLKLIVDSTERKIAIENTSYERKIEDLKNEIKVTRATKKNATKIIEAINKQIEAAEAQHHKNLEKLTLESSQRQLDLEEKFNSLRLEAVIETSVDGVREASAIRLQTLGLGQRKELLELQKHLQEGVVSETEAEEMRTLIALKYAQMRQNEEEATAEKLAELVEKRYADEQTIRDNAYISESNALKMKYAELLAETKDNLDKQAELTARFEDEQARMAERYAKECAKATIKMLEEVLTSEELSAEERLKYEQELAKAKVDFETLMADATIAEIKRTTMADNDATEKRKANAQQWLQVAADSLNSISDLVATVYDSKIAKVEEEQETNNAAGDAEVERITRLVEQQVITEEEGEARKRAAEDQTAKKNEELEKKKQQLKHKQAVWDKANSIAQAGIATALAITQALPNIVLAAIAGAMGAVQLATILATPIPKYAKGTDSHKGGPAIVGDGGVPELVIFGGKSWITPDKPTIIDLPAGAVVKPTVEGLDEVPGFISMPIADEGSASVVVNNDYSRLESKMDTFIAIMRRHSNRQYQRNLNLDIRSYINSNL